MSSRESQDPVTVDQLLAQARANLVRLTPDEPLAALEWRLDPGCEHRDPDVARADRQIVVVCDEGYQSSLAAPTLRRLGLDATDVIRGVQSGRADGLPLD